jgi:hypothetical protein
MTLRLFSIATVTVAAFLAAPPAARAQTTVRFGLRLGGNLATRAGDDPAYQEGKYNGRGASTSTQTDYVRRAILGPQFGAVLEVGFGIT